MGLLVDLFVVFVGDLGMKKGLSNDSPEIGCGSWIWTNDLRVMSPTSYPCSTPRYFVHSPECVYIITRSLMFVKRFTKKIYKKSKFPLKPLLTLCLSVIIYAAVPWIFERFLNFYPKFLSWPVYCTPYLLSLSQRIKPDANRYGLFKRRKICLL